MGKNERIAKAVRQHCEIDSFFAGGFAIKGQAVGEQYDTDKPACETAIEFEKIVSEIQQCRKCSLGELRTNAVPGEGNLNAQIVFVGEGPGGDEDRQGRPFVGRAGQLLDKIIAGMKLKRSDVFICNILKCRPPDNRDPKPDEIIQCLPYLQRQLELINPEIIVALGAHAARTLLSRSDTIGQLRGRIHEYFTSPDKPAIKLIATYHPAYLLRSYSRENRQKVWDDMKTVLAEIGLSI